MRLHDLVICLLICQILITRHCSTVPRILWELRRAMFTRLLLLYRWIHHRWRRGALAWGQVKQFLVLIWPLLLASGYQFIQCLLLTKKEAWTAAVHRVDLGLRLLAFLEAFFITLLWSSTILMWAHYNHPLDFTSIPRCLSIHDWIRQCGNIALRIWT